MSIEILGKSQVFIVVEANEKELAESITNIKILPALKQAIATSSGFQRWQIEHRIGDQSQDYTLDNRVRRYLRETLETLAY